MDTKTIRLSTGERIDVVKEAVGYSIIGPAIVVVLKEEVAVGVTTSSNPDIYGPTPLRY